MTKDILGAALFLAFLIVTLWLSGFYIDFRLANAERNAQCVYGCVERVEVDGTWVR
jgi:hypothetical protein